MFRVWLRSSELCWVAAAVAMAPVARAGIGAPRGPSAKTAVLQGLDIPDLMRVDPAAKTITALDVGRRGESSEIASVQVSDGRLVLSGTGGEGRGWTFAIQRDTGDSVLTVNDASTALMIFGECTGA